jgi:hypothetical protein
MKDRNKWQWDNYSLNNSEEYLQDIFYNSEFEKPKIKKLMKAILKISDFTWIDQLDCNISFARQKTDLRLEDFWKVFDKTTIYNFKIVIRRGFYKIHFGEILLTAWDKENDVTYYLWVDMSKEKLDEFVLKNKITEFSY